MRVNYLKILLLWVACWALPRYADVWPESLFPLLQSAVASLLLWGVYQLTDESWRKWFGIAVTFQIFLNLGDAISDYDPTGYNTIQAFLNAAEISIILLIGLPTLILRMRQNGLDKRGGESGTVIFRSGNNSAGFPQGPKGG